MSYEARMARLARVEYEGAIYHVTVRGNNRRDLFGDDQDRRRFMERLEEGAEEFAVRVYAFCLMRNHVHLVVETPRGNLGAFMHKLQTAYAVYFNSRRRSSGHLMQGRYGAKLVEGDEYLLALARYVHLNPVFVGAMVRQPLEQRVNVLREYLWSSYRRYLGKREWGFVQTDALLAMMGGRSRAQQQSAFRRYVEAALAESDEAFMAIYKGSRLGIGGEAFLAKLGALYEEAAGRRGRSEDVVLRRVVRRVEPDHILMVVCRHFGVAAGEERLRRRGSWVRAVGARMLSRFAGQTQREIAERFGVGSGKAISAQLQCLASALATDKALRRRVHAVEQELTGAQDATKY